MFGAGGEGYADGELGLGGGGSGVEGEEGKEVRGTGRHERTKERPR